MHLKKKERLYSTNFKTCIISDLVICSALLNFTSDGVEAKDKVLFDVANVLWSLTFFHITLFHDF